MDPEVSIKPSRCTESCRELNRPSPVPITRPSTVPKVEEGGIDFHRYQKHSIVGPYCAKSRRGWNRPSPVPRHSVGTYSGSELTRNSSGNIRPYLSKLAEPRWTGPGINSEISVREIISTLKKAQAGNEWSNIFPKSSQARKKPPVPKTLHCRPLLYQEHARVK